MYEPKNGHVWTLLDAIEDGNFKIVDALLKGGKIKEDDLNEGYGVPLGRAVMSAQTKIVQRLIDAGADVGKATDSGETLLHLAIQNTQKTSNVPYMEYRNVAAVLIDAGADMNAQTSSGTTPLIRAAALNCAAGLQLLIEKGADINLKNNRGETALHHASLPFHDAVVVHHLIKAGADLHARDDRGQTALHVASGPYGWEDTAIALVSAGAKIDVKDNNGMTPLMITQKYGNKDVEAVLLRASDLGSPPAPPSPEP